MSGAIALETELVDPGVRLNPDLPLLLLKMVRKKMCWFDMSSS